MSVSVVDWSSTTNTTSKRDSRESGSAMLNMIGLEWSYAP
jgi:hypothetical protein